MPTRNPDARLLALDFTFEGETHFVGLFSTHDKAVERAARCARSWISVFLGCEHRHARAEELLARPDLALQPCDPRGTGEPELLNIVGADGRILVLDAFTIQECRVDEAEKDGAHGYPPLPMAAPEDRTPLPRPVIAGGEAGREELRQGLRLWSGALPPRRPH